MSDSGVFMDIHPRFDMAAANVLAQKAVGVFKSAGRDAGEQWGAGFSSASKRGTDDALKNLTRVQNAYMDASNAAVAASTKVERSAGAQEAAFTKAVRSADLATVATKRLSEVTVKYGDDSSQAALAQVRLGDAQAKAMKDVRALTAATVAAGKAQTGLTSATTAHAAAQTAMGDASAAAEARLTKSAQAMALFGTVANTAGKVALVGLGAAMAETSGKAAEFEQTQTRLVTSAGESASNIQMVSQGILDMAGQVGVSAQELSKGMYLVESAGHRGSDALGVLKAAAQGAAIEGADMKDTVNALTTTLHDFGTAAGSPAEAMSKMIVAVSHSKTTLQDFASALHSVEPTAANAKIGIDDLFGSLAAMSASGESSQLAAEHLNHAILKLQSPTKAMIDELGQVGVNAEGLSLNLSKRGLAGSIQDVSNAILSHLNPQQQLAISAFNQNQVASRDLQVSFDKLSPAARRVADAIKNGTLSFQEFRKSRGGLSVEDAKQVDQWATLNDKVNGFTAAIKNGGPIIQTYQQAMAKATGDMTSLDVALMLGGDNAGYANDAIKAVANATTDADGSVRGMAEANQTASQKFRDLKAELGAVAVQVGNLFLPALKSVADVLKGVFGWLEKHQGVAKGIVVALTAAAGAWVAYKVATGLATVAMIAFDVAADANPVGAIVLAVEAAVAAFAALVYGLVEAYDHVTWFHDGVDAVWDGLKVFASWIWDVLKAVWKAVTVAISGYWKAMWVVIQPGLKLFKIGLELLGIAWHWLYDNAVKPVGNGIKLVIDGLKPEIDGFKELFVSAWHAIGDALKWVWDHILKPIFDAVSTGLHFIEKGLSKIPGANTFLGGDDPPAKPAAPGAPGAPAAPAAPGAPPAPPGPPAPVDPGAVPPGLAAGLAGLPGLPDGTPSGLPSPDGTPSGLPSPGAAPDPMPGAVPGAYDPAAYGAGGLDAGEAYAKRVGDGRRYQYGGIGGSDGLTGGMDCSGFMSDIYAQYKGLPEGQRYFTTEADFEKLGFQPGYKPGAFNIGVHRGGGGMNSHMAGTLPNGVNVESGGPHDSTLYGGAAAGANDPQFELKYHLDVGGGGIQSSPYASMFQNMSGPAGGGAELRAGAGRSGKSSGSSANYNPYPDMTQASNYKPQSIVQWFGTYLAEMAMGNPFAALNGGASAWPSVGGGAGGMRDTIGQEREQEREGDREVEDQQRLEAATERTRQAQIRLNEARAQYGDNSPQAEHAGMALGNAQRGEADAQEKHQRNLQRDQFDEQIEGQKEQERAMRPARRGSGSGLPGLGGPGGIPLFGASPLTGGGVGGGGIGGGAGGMGGGLGSIPGAGGLGGMGDDDDGGLPGLSSSSPTGSAPGVRMGESAKPGLFGGDPTGSAFAPIPGMGNSGLASSAANGPGAQIKSNQMSGGGKGFGIGGGLIGMAESAPMAAMGAAGGAGAMFGGGAAAAGASAAMQIGEQEANRAAGYVGQLAGIGVEGLMETFGLNDSALSDPSKSLIGKVVMGVAGAHSDSKNTAGASQPPVKKDDSKDGKGSGDGKDGQKNGPLVHIENQTVNNGDGGSAGRDIARQLNQYQTTP